MPKNTLEDRYNTTVILTNPVTEESRELQGWNNGTEVVCKVGDYNQAVSELTQEWRRSDLIGDKPFSLYRSSQTPKEVINRPPRLPPRATLLTLERAASKAGEPLSVYIQRLNKWPELLKLDDKSVQSEVRMELARVLKHRGRSLHDYHIEHGGYDKEGVGYTSDFRNEGYEVVPSVRVKRRCQAGARVQYKVIQKEALWEALKPTWEWLIDRAKTDVEAWSQATKLRSGLIAAQLITGEVYDGTAQDLKNLMKGAGR